MNVQTIFIIAAMGGVFAFSRDLIGAVRNRRKRLTDEEDRFLKEPTEMNNIILGSTKEAVALQASVLQELRGTLDNERRDKAEIAAQLAECEAKLASEKSKVRDLYLIIGQMRSGHIEGNHP